MLAHLAWKTLCRPAGRRLAEGLRTPRQTQERVLHRLLRNLSGTAFGRSTGLDARMSISDFQKSIPISGYEDFKSYVERAASGEPQVLTRAPALMFETSSGTSSSAKLIPYTKSLRAEFQETIRAWMSDLYASFPAISTGRHYWSITPLHREQARTSGGIPIGFEEDAEYLGILERWLSRRLFAVPSSVRTCPDMDSCLAATRDHLAKAGDLTFISVWSPSFLHLLLDGYTEPASKRWPRLALVSCWGDAASRPGFESLKTRLPGVTLQAKGLLATEGVMTLPLASMGGCVPALTSHFLEFVPIRDEAPAGPALLCDELQQGEEYSVLLTTGGGLCRYRIGDRVRCTGISGGVPLLEFLGKEDGVSDLHGEKLNPVFVGQALERLRSQHALGATFLMLAPADDAASYLLFAGIDAPRVQELPLALDTLLQENPHYRYCRQLGQLGAVRGIPVSHAAAQRYLERCVALGQRAGDVKPAALHRARGWEVWLSS